MTKAIKTKRSEFKKNNNKDHNVFIRIEERNKGEKRKNGHQ